MHALGFQCAIETNGTLEPPPGIDWITVSPKGTAPLRIKRANELKLVFPQVSARPEQFVGFEAEHYFLQPMDGPDWEENTNRSEEHTSELQSLMRISYAVFCLKKKRKTAN